jgi:hypothetical protein
VRIGLIFNVVDKMAIEWEIYCPSAQREGDSDEE